MLEFLKGLTYDLIVDFVKEHYTKLLFLLPPAIARYIENNAWMIFSGLITSIALYLLYQQWAYSSVGISKVYKSESLSIAKMLQKAEVSFYFLGTSARTTATDIEVQTQLIQLRKSNPSAEIKFLIMNPDASENIKSRANDEQASDAAWSKDMEGSIESLKHLSHRHSLNIQIRLYDAYPLWRMIVIDKKCMFLNYALPSIKINRSPAIKMVSKNSSLFGAFIKHFEILWNHHSTMSVDDWEKTRVPHQ